MGANYTFVFLPRANDDLTEIMDYISKKLCNPKAAFDLGLKLFESIDIVCEHPESGVALNNDFIYDPNKVYRKIFVENYIVIYKIEHQTKNLVIMRIIYGQRDINQILEKL